MSGVLAVAAGCSDGPTADDPTAKPTITPTASTLTPTTASTTTPTVDRQALLDDARVAFGAPGALAVLRTRDGEWRGSSGTADLDGAPITGTTRLRIASITKPIVAFLVLDAVDRGELSLDDEVSRLLPDVLPADPPTSVRMLLDHTSGIFNVGDEGDIRADIGRLTDPALRAEAEDLGARYLAGEHVSMPDRLFVALALTHERYFPPGTGYHYSNVNYQLAGMVLTQVTGMSLADLLRTRLVDPLGLQYTTLAVDGTDLPDMRGYGIDPAGGPMVDLTEELLALGNGGGGGVISTGDELLTIIQSIVAGRLLPSSLVEEMTSPTSQSDDSYGLGVATYRLSCGTFFGHGGAMSGTRSLALASPDGSQGIVLAANVRGEGDEPDLLPLAEMLLC